MERKIEKKDNFFSVELREGERVVVSVYDDASEDSKPDEIVFITPDDMTLNAYMKKKSTPIQFK